MSKLNGGLWMRGLAALWVVGLWTPAGATAGRLPEPELKWSVQLKGDVATSPIPYPRATPDSIVLANGGRVTRISGDGRLMYDIEFGPETGRGGVSEPSLGDVTGDGADELILGHKRGYVYVVRASDGVVLWSYDLGSPLDTWEFAVAADITGDGRAEVIAPNLYGWIHCISPDGGLMWRSKVEDYRPSTVAVADVTRDGEPNIVYGTATRHLIALNAKGEVVWDSFQPPLHLGRTQPLVADLTGDGAPEVYSLSSMIALDTGLICVNGLDGTTRWAGENWSKAYMARSIGRFADGTPAIVIGDKGNYVAAYQPDGRRRWRSQVSGRGVWTPPAVADIDGNGTFEIVFTIRERAVDGSRYSWYVLSMEDGEMLGAYDHGGGFASPYVGDVDGDGLLEVVLGSKDGRVLAYTFGGPATADAVVHGYWNDNAYPVRDPEPAVVPHMTPPSITLLEDLPALRYGLNAVTAKLPDAASEGQRLGVEVSVTSPDGVGQIQMFHVDEGASRVELLLPAYLPGRHKIQLRLMDLASGTVLGIQHADRSAGNLTKALASATRDVVGELESAQQTVTAGDWPRAAVSLVQRASELQAEYAVLEARIKSAGGLATVERDALADDTDAYLRRLDQSRALARLVAAEVEAGRKPSFVMWQDVNPWDNSDPLESLPAAGGPLSVDMWAFGNEIESVSIHLANISPDSLSVRVEPGTLARRNTGETVRPAHEVTKLMRAVRLPSVFGEVVPDVLPELGPGYLIDIAPGEAQSLWINVYTEHLEPGKYALTWPVRTMDVDSLTYDLTVNLDVSPVALPEESRFYAGFWSRPRIDGFSTVADLNEHLQTIWYQIPLPSAQADAAGNIVGQLDWTLHDEILTEARQVKRILYSGLPVPRFPKGTEVTDALRLTAQRNYARLLVEHLRTLGLDYENFMFYVEDETGLHGTIEHFVERARAIKAVDPKLQVYANPWESIDIEKIEGMWPYADFWQPGMETIEFLGPEYVAAMRRGNKPISTYTPPGNCRVLRPLGFFRAQAWLAYHWGIEGGGWWVYHWGTDLFATHPTKDPDYGAVNYDGRALVTSRRWEANRDGIEDFNMLTLLNEWGADDPEAQRIIREAVGYVAGRVLTGVPREAQDYDVDYHELMRHRAHVRDALERLRR